MNAYDFLGVLSEIGLLFAMIWFIDRLSRPSRDDAAGKVHLAPEAIPPTVPIPAGYALLREGDKRPPGYLWYSPGNGWRPGRAKMFGVEITAAEAETKPYIAPLTEAKTPADDLYTRAYSVFVSGPPTAGKTETFVLPAGVTITRLIPKLCVNPSDGDLDVLFALEFTGKEFLRRPGIERLTTAELFDLRANGWQGVPTAPKYSAQFELVLPFLERYTWNSDRSGYHAPRKMAEDWYRVFVTISDQLEGYAGEAKELARAAVIALLSSKGWTIEFSPDKI